MNVVVLRGVLSSDPTVRELPSGSLLVTLEVSTLIDGTRVGVPVAWFDPPRLPALASGDEVVVRGHVRRRFFRTASGTQSRTEVCADDVRPAGNRRALTSLVRRAVEDLSSAMVSPGVASPGRSAASA